MTSISLDTFQFFWKVSQSETFQFIRAGIEDKLLVLDNRPPLQEFKYLAHFSLQTTICPSVLCKFIVLVVTFKLASMSYSWGWILMCWNEASFDELLGATSVFTRMNLVKNVLFPFFHLTHIHRETENMFCMLASHLKSNQCLAILTNSVTAWSSFKAY